MGRRARPFDDIAAFLAGLVDRVTRRLRLAGRLCRTVVLRLRFGDYARVTCSRTMARATADTASILRTALELLDAARATGESRGLTLVGVCLTNLCDHDGAPSLVCAQVGHACEVVIERDHGVLSRQRVSYCDHLVNCAKRPPHRSGGPGRWG
ncbi:MAG: hypothetical protein M3Y17_07610 [Actinomycetota bacterium]|nr:hypothetical protein [Actinomycetota bacterium]